MLQSEGQDLRKEALRQARKEVAEEFKRETVDLFGELLERLWSRLISLIGEIATVAVFRAALREKGKGYPFLRDLQVHSEGICLDRLREGLNTLDQAEVREGLLAFMDGLMALLMDLTGDVLIRKVGPLVQQFKNQLEAE